MIRIYTDRTGVIEREYVEKHVYDISISSPYSLELDTMDLPLVGVYVEASNSIVATLYGSVDGLRWFEIKSWSNVTKINEVLWNVFRYVKITVAPPSPPVTVSIILAAKG